MHNFIESLGDAAMFSTPEARSGYWQIEIDTMNNEKTAFTSHYDLFPFTRMPHGLCNSPVTFQIALHVILSSLKSKVPLVYLYDIVVFTEIVKAVWRISVKF